MKRTGALVASGSFPRFPFPTFSWLTPWTLAVGLPFGCGFSSWFPAVVFSEPARTGMTVETMGTSRNPFPPSIPNQRTRPVPSFPAANEMCRPGRSRSSRDPHRPKIPGRAERGRRGCQRLPEREICKLLTRPHDTRLTAPLSHVSRRRRRPLDASRSRSDDREKPLNAWARGASRCTRGCEVELADHSRPW